ncbi:MAG: HupE/UreJ family protein [Rhodocyclaceae bacterium]|nr:HupE/UreJ family protein [Rhodocyclaceae bacterium]
MAGSRRGRRRGARPKGLAAPALAAVGLFASPLARAHHMLDGATPGSLLEGFVSGIAHPFIGLDHFFFLLTVGMLLVDCPPRLRLDAAAALAVGILAGVIAAVSGLVVPLAGLYCVLTLIGAGAAALSMRDVRRSPLVGLVGFAALFHGFALAAAVVGCEPTPLIAYLVGLSITAGVVVLGVGILAAALATGFDGDFPRRSRCWTGVAAVAIGNLMLLTTFAGAGSAG